MSTPYVATVLGLRNEDIEPLQKLLDVGSETVMRGPKGTLTWASYDSCYERIADAACSYIKTYTRTVKHALCLIIVSDEGPIMAFFIKGGNIRDVAEFGMSEYLLTKCRELDALP